MPAIPIAAVSEEETSRTADHDPGSLLRNLTSRLRQDKELRTLQIALYGRDDAAKFLHALDPPELGRDAEGEHEKHSPARLVWNDHRPLLISTSADSTRFPRYVAWMRKIGLQDEWVMPILSGELGDRCLGAIGFGLVNGRPCIQSDRDGLATATKGSADAWDNVIAGGDYG